MTAQSLAEHLEAERFDRYGLDQPEMRIACSVILDVLQRFGVDRLSLALDALRLYPAMHFHADKEPFR